MDAAQQFSGLQNVHVVAGDEVHRPAPGAAGHHAARACTRLAAPAVSEIIGPAGSDMQMLPPTVAAFQILNDARNELQHWWNSAAAVHSGGR